jgi:hypothetical protein
MLQGVLERTTPSAMRSERRAMAPESQFLTEMWDEISEAYDTMHKVFGSDAGIHFKTWLRAYIAKSLYLQANPNGPSDDDVMAVMLRVSDWKAIYEDMIMDVDACPEGSATSMLDRWPEGEATDEQYEIARRRDAQLPAYSNGPATERAAEVINDTLRMWGHNDDGRC